MLSAAVACLPTAVSLLLLAALFMQISGVSLALTWPRRLYLLRVLLCMCHCYKLSPFQVQWGGDTAPAFSGLCVYYSSCGSSPLSCGVFLPPPLSQAFLLLVAGRTPPLPAEPLHRGPACLFTVPGRIPLPPFWHSVRPILCNVSLLFLLLITQFLFFPQVEVGLSRGLC
jgi:hypothetical protein